MEVKNNFKIKRVNKDNLEIVWSIIKICSDQLLGQGFDHWDKYYTKEIIEKKFISKEVFLVNIDDKSVATFILGTDPVDYYTDKDLMTFTDPKEKAIYFANLSVLPEYQKKGIASKILEFIEEEAKTRKIKYIRFDCKAFLVSLVKFYLKRNYKIAGMFIDNTDHDEPYFLMEKIL